MAHDVFISYSSKDKPIADGICANLEAAGIRCWIAPRDIVAGEAWPSAISNAITHSQVMVLVFSSHSNASEDVSRELNLAASNKVVIIPFKIENVKLDPAKTYYLSTTHWLDAMNPPTQAQIQELTKQVKKHLPPAAGGEKPVPATAANPPAQPARKRKYSPWLIGGGIATVLMAGVILCVSGVFLAKGFLFPKAPTQTAAVVHPIPSQPAFPAAPTTAPTLSVPLPVSPAATQATQAVQPQPTTAPAVSVDIKRIAYYETQVLKLAWLPDSTKVLLAGFELHPYDVASQKATIPIDQRVLDSVAVAPDAKMFVVATTWDGIQVFKQNWGNLGTLPMSTDGHGVMFTPDGKNILAAKGNLIKVWDAATQAELTPLPLPERVDGLAVSPDGKILAVSLRMEIKLLSIEGEELFSLTGHGHQIFALAFSPDGKTLASGSLDNTIRLWDVATGQLLQILTGHTGTVNGVGFSPDGRLLASASDDTTIRVWDVASGTQLQTLYDHTEAATSAVFSPDGTMLATGSYDKMQLWSVTYNNQ